MYICHTFLQRALRTLLIYKVEKSVTMESFWIDAYTESRSGRLLIQKEESYTLYTPGHCSDKNISEFWRIFLASASDKLLSN